MLTSDRNNKGINKKGKDGQDKVYLILSDKERAKGFIRKVRTSYVHDKCGGVTSMPMKIAETYAREPTFYGSTFCFNCGNHYPVKEFRWKGSNAIVGS